MRNVKVRVPRVRVQILFVLLLAYASLGVGCPKDPYRASLQGSDDVARAVGSGIKIATQYYSTGKFTDQQKAVVAQLLTNVTNANMTFRHQAVALHTTNTASKNDYINIAQAFIAAVPDDPTQLRYFSADSQKLYAEVVGPVRVAINGISLAIQQAKGQ